MFTPDLLKGRRILVIGGGTGLGYSMGRRFLELGAALVICGRRAQVLEEAAQRLRAETGGAASQFNFLSRLGDADWRALRPKKA